MVACGQRDLKFRMSMSVSMHARSSLVLPIPTRIAVGGLFLLVYSVYDRVLLFRASVRPRSNLSAASSESTAGRTKRYGDQHRLGSRSQRPTSRRRERTTPQA